MWQQDSKNSCSWMHIVAAAKLSRKDCISRYGRKWKPQFLGLEWLCRSALEVLWLLWKREVERAAAER